MKHWHRCSRWNKRLMDCPFEGVPEHPRDGPDDEIEFSRIGGAPTPERASFRGRKDGRPTVGVREPRRPGIPAREGEVAATPEVDVPMVDLDADVAKRFRFPQKLRHGAAEAVGDIQEAYQFAGQIGETEHFWRGTPGIDEDQQQLAAAAEIAAAEAAGRSQQEYLESIIAILGTSAVSSIPLMREGLRALRQAQGRPALLGKPGSIVSADMVQPRGPGGHGPATTRTPPGGYGHTAPTAGARPVTTTRKAGGARGPARHVDARNLLQGMISSVQRRHVRKFKQADPNL